MLLQRVDNIKIHLHTSLHLSALACTCLHLHNHTVDTCTYEGTRTHQNASWQQDNPV